MRRMERLLSATARAERHHFWFRGFRRFVSPLLEEATKGLSDVRLLDCGCGTGANLEMLGRFGRAYGFDMTFWGLQAGGRCGRTRLARASVAAVPFPDDFFDVATSFDVLYALEPPIEAAAVAEMHRVVRPGGFVLVNVAAMNALRGDHSVLGHEVRRYTRGSLRRLLTGHGFTIARLTYTNASLFLPMLVLRSLQRWRGLATEETAAHEIAVPWAPINEALTLLLRAESQWLRVVDNPFGSSLLCLARKPDRSSSGRP
jgi:SAM-dependent methyltransferase